ncbi:MAG: RNA polymerase sigma factor [Lachnospiraceae bacterium]
MLFYLAMIESEEDKRKFERIYLAYKQTMYYAANRVLKNVHTSEDAVHQAFIRIINHLEKINENECHKTRAFLVVITEHIAIDIYRKQKKESTLSYDELEIYVADTHVENYAETDELTAVYEKLPVNYSTVLRLKFSQGYSDSEISAILNITEENVRKRISRAKKKLAQLLQKEGDTE